MAKKKAKRKFSLWQTNVEPDLDQRLYESPEYKLLRNKGAALRAILDRVLPKTVESQG